MSSPEFNLVLNVKLFAKTFAQPKSQVPPDEILMMPKVELFYDWNCCDRSTVYTNISLKGMFRTVFLGTILEISILGTRNGFKFWNFLLLFQPCSLCFGVHLFQEWSHGHFPFVSLLVLDTCRLMIVRLKGWSLLQGRRFLF